MPSVHVITLFVFLLLQLGETREWLKFDKEPNITYDKDDLQFEPELIASETIEVGPSLNRLIKPMEKDIQKFSMNFQRHIDEMVHRFCRTIQEELKMPCKPELWHQYGMLFNHQGYVMPGLQLLQLFLAIDFPKIEDLYHDPPAFPNYMEWAAPYLPNIDYYNTMGEGYIKWTAYKDLNDSVSFLDEAVHHKVCIQYQTKYNNLLLHIRQIHGDIEYKIKHVMPKLLPNE